MDFCADGRMADLCLHGPCCVIFMILGAIQITSGIYYYLTIPVFKLIFNITIGCSVVVIGICGVIVVCICTSSTRKYEILLYCSTSIIFLNTVNLILLEFGQIRDVFHEPTRTGATQRPQDPHFEFIPSEGGRLITSVTAIVSVLVAFLESQITFCCLNRVHQAQQKALAESYRKRRVERGSDQEYVLDKRTDEPTPGNSHNSAGATKKPNDSTKIEVYAQSWVFEESHAVTTGMPPDSPASISSPENSTRKQHVKTHPRRHRRTKSGSSQMVSFSRATTPIPPSTPVPPDHERPQQQNHSRQNSDFLAVTPRREARSPNRPPKMGFNDFDSVMKLKSKIANTAQADASYATLMAELERSLSGKQVRSPAHSSDDSVATLTDHPPSNSSKEEFSRELEAALQLIQDLETPSECPPTATTFGYGELNRAGSDKTLSAVSLTDFTSPDAAPSAAFPSNS
ncbi:uncharacterized protein LOC129791593 [Lutzomyia longipalpis]|uniref:uncharacterized protein LOC129791593 n=1 Tax=Lutzomyia longipalpis TaxID=7200 RepID=UPI0024844E83|nr:uncharacterized protein LOC129791593 [Lutzomyia longipalpis]